MSRFSLIFLLFLVAACVPLAQKTVEIAVPTGTPALTETVIPTVESELTIEKLQNMSYLSPNSGMTVQLTNGIFTEDSTTISLLPQIAIGDLNEDQVDDAVVLLSENTGGTGNFISVVVIVNRGGEYLQTGSVFIDDRPMIQSLVITEGRIVLDATIHGINDAMVSPTHIVHQTYKLLENNLTLMSQNSTTQGGSERSITIEAPLSGSEVTAGVQIKGSMPIAPFENNLRFRVVDMAGNEVLSEGFMVQSEDVGGPCVFDNAITFPAPSSGTWVRLELAELSMADGSVVTLNSVLVKVK